MKNKSLKDNKAITLIALVITIIVLLLLAGISISMLSGQDGILTKASEAKEATKNTEDYEEVVLAVQTALAEGLGKVDLTDGGDLETALGSNYNYIGEGIVEKDGKYYTVGEDGTVINGGVKVGQTITYTPPEVKDAKWSAEYSGLKDKDSTATDAVLDNTLDITDENSFKVTSWKVLSVEDGKVNLISAEPTVGKVYLGYANGYNNAVKLLNDSCNALYGDASKGITGRNIKIEDIEGLMTEEGLASAHVKYELQDTSAYTTKYNYPTIYAQEKLSVINGVKNTTGLGMSEQDKYYTLSTQPEATEDGTKSIQPYQTYWYESAADMKKYLGVTGNLSTSTNYELIMPKQNSTPYWVASRCVDARGGYCDFYVRRVISGDMGAWLMCDSDDVCNGGSLALRPIVSLSSDLLVRAEDGTWSVK